MWKIKGFLHIDQKNEDQISLFLEFLIKLINLFYFKLN